jgi:hypothetical protein
MEQGVPAPTPAGPGSPSLPTPSTPYDLSGVHPGDARHSILEIRMSGSRSSGNRVSRSVIVLFYPSLVAFSFCFCHRRSVKC